MRNKVKLYIGLFLPLLVLAIAAIADDEQNKPALQNQLLYSKPRTEKDIETFRARFREFAVEEKDLLIDVGFEFPDGKMYHGTWNVESANKIVSDGPIPLTNSYIKSVGNAVYGLSKKNWKHTADYGKFVIEFEVNPTARMLDTSKRKAQRLCEMFWKKYPVKESKYDEFADYFGIDILKYSKYGGSFGVKNIAVLNKPILHEAKNLNYRNCSFFLRSIF